MAKTSACFLLFLTIFCHSISAQEHRYVVHFADKENNQYSIDRPLEFLSQNAIDRRQRQGIAITTQDLPVTSGYVQTLTTQGAEVLFTSRWFNAALIILNQNEVTNIEDLNFVNKVELVAPASAFSSREKTHKKFDLEFDDESVNMEATDFQNQMLGVDQMHQEGFRGEGMLIVVVDGGFTAADELPYFEHLFNENRVLDVYNFVEQNQDVYKRSTHGTRVLACIGASFPQQITGTAPGANFALFISEDVGSEYRIEEYNWVFAAERADSLGADVINTSLGYNQFDDPSMDYAKSDIDGQTAVISRAANIAAEKGMVIVNSAGNSGNNAWQIITPPADAEHVLSVGSVTTNFLRSSFSSLGPTADGRIKPDVMALGSGTVVGVDVSTGGIVSSNGTSFSSPLVAGLSAGLWQAFPGLTSFEVMQVLKESADNAATPNNEFGYGIPNFTRAQEIADELQSNIKLDLKAFPNPVLQSQLTLSSNDVNLSGRMEYTIYNPLGQLIATGDRLIGRMSQQVDIPFERIPPGIYFLNVTINDQAQSLRVLKY
ncbi:S8 family serine peptidase [Fulvivirgaceae bacterium BMA10]|uniref:S8 family serine peptidase n=1 Tax=Splendidivirga corallicola TaxID=3051826 RepID=A0ABT8KNT9_9BACT|nr:S8 family serine peptidase [Fulvivirgaceae bacterium BMA10]